MKTSSLLLWLVLGGIALGQYEDTGWKTAGRSGIPNANEVFPAKQQWREVQLHKTSAVTQAARNCVRLQFGNHSGSGVFR